jgi:class III poly(R)-hydroxyalkanoic acid synthase PhaE subunit
MPRATPGLTAIPEELRMTEANDWSQAWLDTQRQYWDTLFEWSRQAGDAALHLGGKPDLGAGLEPWWQAVSGNLTGEAKETYRRVFDAGRSFFDMGEMFWRLTREAQSAGENWREGLERTLAEFKAALLQTSGEASDAWSGFTRGWGLSGDAWQDFIKSLGQSPVHAEDLTGLHAGEAWNRMMRMPAMGYTREWQEELQQWALMSADFAKASREYAALLHSTNGKAVDLLGRRLVELAQKGASPDTLRGMYDLWVDCGEEAYAELAVNDDYLKAQGNLTNSMMRLKQHERVMMEGLLTALGIPGRRELDTALRRLQETRRELRDLRDQFEDAGADRLRAELSELRAELRALQGGRSQVGRTAERPRQTAAAKPAATKTAAKRSTAKPATGATKTTAAAAKAAPKNKVQARKKAAARKA